MSEDLTTDDLRFYLDVIDRELSKYKIAVDEISVSIDSLLAFNEQLKNVL